MRENKKEDAASAITVVITFRPSLYRRLEEFLISYTKDAKRCNFTFTRAFLFVLILN